jgi:hypothetical protein
MNSQVGSEQVSSEQATTNANAILEPAADLKWI